LQFKVTIQSYNIKWTSKLTFQTLLQYLYKDLVNIFRTLLGPG